MRLRFRDLLFTGALLAGVVLLYALQNSRAPAPAPAPASAPKPVAIDVPLPSPPPARSFDRYRQFGMPAASEMLLYFPMSPAPLPAVLKKLDPKLFRTDR